MVCRAVIFDYIGTLVNCGNYTMPASREKLHHALVAEGFEVDKDKFWRLTLLHTRNPARSAMSSSGK